MKLRGFRFPPHHRIERFRNKLIISPSGQEGMADRQEPLDGQRHGAVDAAQEAHLGDRDGVRQGRDLDRLCHVRSNFVRNHSCSLCLASLLASGNITRLIFPSHVASTSRMNVTINSCISMNHNGTTGLHSGLQNQGSI